MNLAALGFRFRVIVFVLLYLLGFFPPWEWRSDTHNSLWLAASTWVAGTGQLGLAAATLTVTLAALGCLVLGALLRLWGTAYLGSDVMRDALMRGDKMRGDAFVAAGPYLYLRNPLYLGTWLLSLGISILMPPSGAALFLPALTVFLLVLISAEERFLLAKQGEAYQRYRGRVPRLLPCLFSSLSSQMTAGDTVPLARPRWLQAVLAETYPIGITICFAVFAWRYNARILVRCVLICYGLSLVVRAMMKQETKPM